jgi:hypothetical protein
MDDPMKQAQFLTKLLGSAKQNHFRMEWEGSKIPRGASINGVEIGWTQHGIVTGKNSEQLGYYEREVEFGGDSGSKHVMVISTNHSAITPPPGGTVEPVIREKDQGRT